jgi:hypothetical protein
MSRQLSDATQQLIGQYFDAEDAALAQDQVAVASTQAADDAASKRDQDIQDQTAKHQAAHDLAHQLIAAITAEVDLGTAPAAAGLLKRIKDRRAKRHGG